MRIISGKLRGHKFNPPANSWPTRPTTDISKEGLFNILQNQIDFETCRMLDLFGGTGNHCFEFISRGCTDATYVDKHRPASSFVKQQAIKWKIKDALTIHVMDVKKFISRYEGPSFDYIFAGPPYPLPWLNSIPELIFGTDLLSESGLFVLEHNPKHNFKDDQHLIQLRTYGQTHFSFFG